VSSQAIIIIGAGAAGLAAARDLSRAGREVIVLEARDRIGGRVLTHKQKSDPVPIELGAEFVHGKPPEICELAAAANLELYEVSGRHWYFDGDKVTHSQQFWKQIDALMDKMKTSDSDQSLREFLDSIPDNEKNLRAKAMLTRYVEGFHAANPDRIGIQGLIKAYDAADSIEGDRAFRLTDGYDPLMQALRGEAESYGAIFHLNSVVHEINWSNDELTVTGASQGFSGHAAIITLPLSLLQANSGEGRIRFMPELPTAKQQAIDSLAMGNVIRINLLFRERFWEQVKRWDKAGERVSFADAGFFHCPDAPVPTWWTQLPMRARVLVGWAGGPRADRLSNLSEGELLDQAIASLARIFDLSPETVMAQFEASHIHDWRRDPFTLGCYSYVPINSLNAQHRLAEPLGGRLFFAGEATSVGHIGTVHGAIQSGQRAAREVLNPGPSFAR
jgi:monoamine oxidase